MTESEYRAKLKANHICRDCKQTDAYTLAGRTYCAECAEKMANRKKKKTGIPRRIQRKKVGIPEKAYRRKALQQMRKEVI